MMNDRNTSDLSVQWLTNNATIKVQTTLASYRNPTEPPCFPGFYTALTAGANWLAGTAQSSAAGRRTTVRSTAAIMEA